MYVLMQADRTFLRTQTTPITGPTRYQLSCGTSTVHTCTQYTKIVSDKPIHGMARAYLLELGYSDGLVRVSDEYFVVLDTVVWVAWIAHLFGWGACYYCMGWMDCRNGE